MKINTPYLLFIGDEQDKLSIKLANGVADWRPEYSIGEYALEGCRVSTGMPRVDLEEAINLGAKTLVLGFTNSGGFIDEKWVPTIIQAIEKGMDIASGLHQKLESIAEIREAAEKYKVNLVNVRHPNIKLFTGKGSKRSGKRILTVGTDCSVGKMYSALALEKSMKAEGFNVSFKATGQCGIFIAGDGIAIDCVISDFISGATEAISPDNQSDHWDIIEGQGSLLHPAYAGVSLGLLHGAQPDALILCHTENRESMRGLIDRPLPSLQETMDTNLKMAHLTNPNAKFVGICINTSMLEEDEARKVCENYEKQFSLPAVDPVRHGVEKIVNALK